MRLNKPKVLRDICAKGTNVYSSLSYRVNLAYKRRLDIKFVLIFKFAVVLISLWVFVAGYVVAPTSKSITAKALSSNAERQRLETQLKELEKQIDEYENQIASYQRQGSTLKSEIARLNSKIAKINLQIKAINLSLEELDDKISDVQSKIHITENSIKDRKGMLGVLIKNIYARDSASMFEIFLRNPKISDFFADVNNITLLQNRLRITIEQISDLKKSLEDQKEQFSLAREDAATLRKYQLIQKQEVYNIKKEKNKLLSITKGRESKYQSLLKETKETAAKIRSRIFQLLGGGEMTFEQAYKYAKLASDATGVNPALILAVLDRESALGKYIGSCSYKTAMSPKNIPIFLGITKKLGLDPETVKVSCPNKDGFYGGAMGPAQFIPSTWIIYENMISEITGNDPASPWNNADAFVASALYLRDAGANKNEKIAAARYYCGSRWNRYVCTNIYARNVLERARQFKHDIEVITR